MTEQKNQREKKEMGGQSNVTTAKIRIKE